MYIFPGVKATVVWCWPQISI